MENEKWEKTKSFVIQGYELMDQNGSLHDMNEFQIYNVNNFDEAVELAKKIYTPRKFYRLKLYLEKYERTS